MTVYPPLEPSSAPFRSVREVEPLIEASAMYPRLEELVLGARDRVLMSFRIFDPATKLRSARVRACGYDDWAELMVAKAAEGVELRLLLTDFEPMAAGALHRASWDAVKTLYGAAERLKLDAPERLQVMAVLHEGEFGKVMRRLFWPFVRMRLVRLRRASENGTQARPVSDSPGLWTHLRRRGPQLYVRDWPPKRLWPATYHQKVAVIDGESLVIGGLDVNERRWDDPDHDRPAEETWHDVSLLARGPVVGDALAHLVALWNHEVPRFNARVTRLGAPFGNVLRTVSRLAPVEAPPANNAEPPRARLVRTVSRRSRSPFALGPRTHVREIEMAQLALFESARSLLYVETQFLRSRPLSEALARIADRNKALHLILLLPAAPDDIAFEGNTGPDARHGEWLQTRALSLLRNAFGERMGVFTLAQTRPGEERHERDAVNGRAVVYIHAKVTIADGTRAIVSSGNLNGRSLRWDTEAGLVWEDRREVAAFQDRLWRAHLRSRFAAGRLHGPDALAMWREAARDGMAGEHAPDCFVLPYPEERARAFARRVWYIPHNLV
jgi:phosphatidylserine/phosphatidylglycerophosphate/cardiolipin synthase-like enzyme